MTFHSALVAGATGFIGSALVRRLLAENVEVLCLFRPNQRHVAPLSHAPGIRSIEVSSFERSELRTALAGMCADVVFNLASYGVHPEDRDPNLLIEGNINLVTNLLQTTAHWPLQKFIHTGSCSEYGFPSPGTSLVPESSPVRPTSLYGAAKAASVLFGSALASQLATPFVTLRLFGAFGVGEARHRLIPYLISRLRQAEPADLTPGEQIRDLLYVDDVADAFMEAALSDTLECGQVYNICSSVPVRVREVGDAVADELKKPRALLRWGQRPYRADEPMTLVGNNHRFREATSWRPRVSLQEGIARMVEATNSADIKDHRHAV